MQYYLILFKVASLISPVYMKQHNGGVPDDDVVVEELNSIDDERQMHRLGSLLRSYAERAEERFRDVMGIKKEIEDKSIDQKRAFEMGYIMGDIVEAYRKAIVFTQRQMIKKRYTESARIRYMTYVQNAYIKIYHLAHMMHEINPKYGTDNSGQITKANLNAKYHHLSPTFYNTSEFYYTKELNEIREARVKARLKKISTENKLKESEIEMYGTMKPSTAKPSTRWWPIEYGWDMDYYW